MSHEFISSLAVLRVGLASAVRKTQDLEQGLHCEALCKDGENDNAKR